MNGNGNGNGHIKHRFKPIPFSAITLNTSQSYLIRDLIPTNGLTVVWGPPKCGKSFFVFDAMMHIALGWQYKRADEEHPKRTKQGTVLYITCEGQAGFPARKEAFQQEFMGEEAAAAFHLLSTRLDLAKDADELLLDIRAYMGSEPIAAIVIDTLNRSLAGSESKDEDMAAYILACDAIREAFSCAVVVVHHCGINDQRPRGHTSLTGAADAQISIKKADITGTVTAKVEFMKDGPDELEFCFHLRSVIVGQNEDGDDITSCVLESSDEQPAQKPKPQRLNNAAKIALDTFHKTQSSAGEPAPASNHIPSGATVVRIDTWRRFHYSALGSDMNDEAKKKNFQRSRESLQAAGLLGIHGEFGWMV